MQRACRNDGFRIDTSAPIERTPEFTRVGINRSSRETVRVDEKERALSPLGSPRPVVGTRMDQLRRYPGEPTTVVKLSRTGPMGVEVPSWSSVPR